MGGPHWGTKRLKRREAFLLSIITEKKVAEAHYYIKPHISGFFYPDLKATNYSLLKLCGWMDRVIHISFF